LIAETDLSVVRLAMERETGFITCRSKLAEILEKVLKAELIRLGWPLEKTHDLNRLSEALGDYGSPLRTTVVPICQALAEVYFTDRYPGFDLEDPDWPALRAQVEQVTVLLAAVRARLADHVSAAALSGSRSPCRRGRW
jgi:HEPN domain-containing protein